MRDIKKVIQSNENFQTLKELSEGLEILAQIVEEKEEKLRKELIDSQNESSIFDKPDSNPL